LPKKLVVISREKCTGCGICQLACAHANFTPPFETAVRIKKSIFNEEIHNIKICVNCENPKCVEACPTGYLIRRDSMTGGVKINRKNECIQCGNCYESCLYHYLKPGVDNTPIVCRQCGICAINCPNGCLMMVDLENE